MKIKPFSDEAMSEIVSQVMTVWDGLAMDLRQEATMLAFLVATFIVRREVPDPDKAIDNFPALVKDLLPVVRDLLHQQPSGSVH